jgi:hypothetical protein
MAMSFTTGSGNAGDLIVDGSGNPVNLETGVVYRPRLH